MAKIRQEWCTAAGEWVQEKWLRFCIWQVDLLLVLSEFVFWFYTAPWGPGVYVSLTAVGTSMALWREREENIAKDNTTCVVSDLSDSWPAVVWELPQFRTVGVSSLEHTNFFPPSHVAIVGVQHHVGSHSFIHLSEVVHHHLRVLTTTGRYSGIWWSFPSDSRMHFWKWLFLSLKHVI